VAERHSATAQRRENRWQLKATDDTTSVKKWRRLAGLIRCECPHWRRHMTRGMTAIWTVGSPQCSTSFTYICLVVIDQFGTLQTMPTVASSIQVNSLQFPRTILANGYELSETQLYLLHMCGWNPLFLLYYFSLERGGGNYFYTKLEVGWTFFRFDFQNDNYIYRAHARSICGRAVIFTVRKIKSCDWLIWHSLRTRWIELRCTCIAYVH